MLFTVKDDRLVFITPLTIFNVFFLQSNVYEIDFF